MSGPWIKCVYGNVNNAEEYTDAYISLNGYEVEAHSTSLLFDHVWRRKIGRMEILKMFGEIEGLELISREHIEITCYTIPENIESVEAWDDIWGSLGHWQKGFNVSAIPGTTNPTQFMDLTSRMPNPDDDPKTWKSAGGPIVWVYVADTLLTFTLPEDNFSPPHGNSSKPLGSADGIIPAAMKFPDVELSSEALQQLQDGFPKESN